MFVKLKPFIVGPLLALGLVVGVGTFLPILIVAGDWWWGIWLGGKVLCP